MWDLFPWEKAKYTLFYVQSAHLFLSLLPPQPFASPSPGAWLKQHVCWFSPKPTHRTSKWNNLTKKRDGREGEWRERKREGWEGRRRGGREKRRERGGERKREMPPLLLQEGTPHLPQVLATFLYLASEPSNNKPTRALTRSKLHHNVLEKKQWSTSSTNDHNTLQLKTQH